MSQEFFVTVGADKPPITPSARNRPLLREIIEGEANDFSGSPLFYHQRFIDEELVETVARQRGLEVRHHPQRMLEFSDAERSVCLLVGTPSVSVVSRRISENKMISKQLLAGAGCPLAAGAVFTDYQRALAYFHGRPVAQVVKPVAGMMSRGVTTAVTSSQSFLAAWRKAAGLRQPIMVEDHCLGDELRVIVVAGKAVAAAVRLPAHLIGNGVDGLTTLLRRKNSRRRLNPATCDYPVRLPPSWPAAGNTVPADGEWLILGSVNLSSAGGEYVAVHNRLHPEIIALAERVAGLIPGNLVLGLDMLVRDLERGAEEGNLVITEVNSNPAVGGIQFPSAGRPFDLAGLLVDQGMRRGSFPRHRLARPALVPAPVPEAGYWGDATAFSRTYAVQMEVIQHAAHCRNLVVENLTADRYLYTISAKGDRLGFDRGMSDRVDNTARAASNDKDWTRRRLRLAGINTPDGMAFAAEQAQEAWQFALTLRSPVVVKPVDGSGGQGVTVGIRRRDHFQKAWERARVGSRRVVVEARAPGRDYRLLVIGSRLVAVMLRNPARVTGDGRSAIGELIAAKNRERAANPFHGAHPLRATDSVQDHLAGRGLSLQSVPGPGEVVELHQVANVGSGGEAVDLTDLAHPGFAAIAVDTLRQFFGAPHAGVDLLAEDISRPPEEQEWTVIKVNLNPNLAIYAFLWEGSARDVAGVLLEHLLPGAGNCRAEPQQRHWLIYGRVQGVGYRDWFRRQLQLLGLRGEVRNLEDGSVAGFAEGQKNPLDHLEALCRRGPEKARVERVVNRAPVPGIKQQG